ncbi:sensor histidine kinase [Anoxynatronum buryatiense]|uniref:histidine kinase n=1 Tax=Anoxynatronum buryatiense TaxID=489973 RepID=A0AA46AIW7_9CLOT|nr:ATP-binding protein [Anoxynatronum buryatiense]SMP55210.1 histidine kinase [Anoxynatronum buryatiense]
MDVQVGVSSDGSLVIQAEGRRWKVKPMKVRPPGSLFQNSLKTLITFVLTTGCAVFVSSLGVDKESMIMVFLLGVLFTTVFTSSYLYGIFTSFASLMIFNFLFTEPRYTLVIYSRNDIILLLFFLVTAVVSGIVTSRLQQQMELAARNERTAQTLYQIASGFLSVSGNHSIIQRGISYIRTYAGCESRVTLNQDSGLQADSLSSASSRESARPYSLESAAGPLGTLEVYPQQPMEEQTELIIQAVATQLGIALDREQLYNQQEKTRLAMESERLRAALLRSVAHDLRSPLTALLGAGSLLADEYHHLADEERQQLAKDISEEIIWLTNLVENILDMTRINESQLVIKKESEVVDDVVSEAVSHVERLLRERRFSVSLPEDVVMVPMDGRLIVRVLINLLENAVLHTQPAAEITLTVTASERELVVTVADTGEGIDENLRDSLFDRFVTHDKTVSDSRRGMGLGLANCKALVEAHGGTIVAVPNHPRGSRFVFTLPRGV